jgi:uncharacterized protein
MTVSEIKPPLEALRGRIRRMKGAVLAFSGGVDSTLLAKVAQEELGAKVLAVTAVANIHPPHEIEEAKTLARRIGIRHELLDVDEQTIECFTDNPPNRCYYCKKTLMLKLKEIAEREGFAEVMDGINADDAGHHYPGMKASEELGVRSPLKEAGIGKETVRRISKELGLPTWDRPKSTCLASRFPYGMKITPERLRMVTEAEDYLRALGLPSYRVRHHDTIARIEVPPGDIEKLAQSPVREKLLAAFKRIGYTYVTLDLAGFRSGSMNEVLPK